MSTLKIRKHKLTNAEIAIVVEFLDAFEVSGFAWSRNHGPRMEAYINRYGLRFEVLQAMAQSAVIDYPYHFQMVIGSTADRYSFLLNFLMQTYAEDARITYDEGDGSLASFKANIAFTPHPDEYSQYSFEAGWLKRPLRSLINLKVRGL